MLPSRADAWNLLCEWTESDSLRKHALAVEAVMRAYAKKLGGDEDLFGLVGLLHDFDYEKYNDRERHPIEGSKVLRAKGYPEDVIHAILAHAPYTGTPCDTPMAKAILACDELCGFITAVALVRPSKKLADVEVSSVRKKLKDKAFARSVSREDIHLGVSELGVPMDEHIAFCLEALRPIADKLGL